MPEFHYSYALVVGINDYTNGIVALQNAQPDAQKLAAILQDDHLYQVTLITDDTDIKPTREKLLTFLKNPFPQQQLAERDRRYQILAITNSNPGNSGSPLMVLGAFKISGSRWGDRYRLGDLCDRAISNTQLLV